MIGSRFFRIVAMVALCCGTFALSSCTSGGVVPGTVVDVVLAEFSVTPDSGSAPAGTITFRVRNEGDFTHEFLIIRTDLAPDALPTEDDGSYQENAEGTEVIDEVDGINAGRTVNLTVNLEAGDYVLICNMVAIVAGSPVAHYAEGMRAAFTVDAGDGG